jgi:hypothetical protein
MLVVRPQHHVAQQITQRRSRSYNMPRIGVVAQLTLLLDLSSIASHGVADQIGQTARFSRDLRRELSFQL